MIEDAKKATVLSVLRGDESEQEACERMGVDRAVYRSWEQGLLQERLSPLNEELPHPSLDGTARISRDRWGVAHCFGDSVGDLYFAVGIAQAQDRLWQLDYRRRLASGRLAEVIGPKGLRTDLEYRTLGFRRLVEEVELPALASEAAIVLEAYSAGVNAWIDRVGRNRLPIEFEILEYEPEPWEPADSLAILRYFWWTLTGRLSQLVAAERLLRSASDEIAAWFLQPETISYIVPEPKGEEGEETEEGDTRLQGSSFDGIPGSNNWAVSADRVTGGGEPILAADPHWPLSFPDMWYEQHVCGAGVDCIGPAYPGAPPVIFGRTRQMAWGRTNNVTSTRDLYHERVHPGDPQQYWNGADWEAFGVLKERVAVRGADAIEHEIRLTRRGPVVNDYLPPVEESGDGPIALRWLGQERIGDVQVLLDLSRARSVAQARTVFGGWRLSVWNCVIADSSGEITYQMCGSVPRRRVLTRGTRPAAEEGHEWEGYLDTPDLPGESNPSRGWVATANNPPVGPSAALPMYGTYADAYRVDRIAEFLTSPERLDPRAVAGLQADNLSMRARDLKEAVADILERSESGANRRSAEHLRGWNGCYDLEQLGAAVWETLWPRLVRGIGAAVLDPFAAELNASGAGRLTRHLVLGGRGVPFFCHSLQDVVERAASESEAYLEKALGPDPEQWTWANTMRLRHPLATNAAAERIFNPAPIPCPGGSTVVNTRSTRETEQGFETTGGPSYRLVVDLSSIDGAEGCLLAGQSGQPGSPHYSDQTGLWPAGKWHPLIVDRERIEAESEAETVLSPPT